MLKSKVRSIATAIAVVGMLAGSFAIVPAANAKSPKCFATPVPGKPGVFIVTCTTIRP